MPNLKHSSIALTHLAQQWEGEVTLGFIAMLFDQLTKLPKIVVLQSPLAHTSGFRVDIARLGFALTPQVNRIAANKSGH